MSAITTQELRPDRSASRIFHIIEIVFFCVAIVLCATLVVQHIHHMSTTALWGDEYGSVNHFARNGLWTAWTDYSSENNHIFFNMINSFWPDDLIFRPYIARLCSFVVVVAGFIALFRFAAVSHAWAAGGLVGLALITNVDTGDLLFQARAYGIVFAAALLQSICFCNYAESKASKWIVLALLSGTIGSITLPLYAAYLFLFTVTFFTVYRDRRIVLWALVFLAIGLIFYFPTIGQIYERAITYGDRWNVHYDSYEGWIRTARYLFPMDGSGLVLSSVFAVVFAASLFAGNAERKRQVSVLLLSAALFLGFCRILESPIDRTTQFVIGSVAIASIAAAASIPRGLFRVLLTSLLIVSGLMFAGRAVSQITDDDFLVPIVAHMQTDQIVPVVRPNAESIYIPYRLSTYGTYSDNGDRLTDTFDPAAFNAGDQIVIDLRMAGNPDTRFTSAEHSTQAIDIRVRQKRYGYQTLSFVPRRTGAIRAVKVRGPQPEMAHLAIDTEAGTRWHSRINLSDLKKPVLVDFELDPGAACDRLFIFSGAGEGNRPEGAVVLWSTDQGRKRIKSRDAHWFEDLVVFDLPPETPERITFKVSRAPVDNWFSINEAWCEASPE